MTTYKRTNSRLKLVVAVSVFGLIVTTCGGGGDADDVTTTDAPTATTGGQAPDTTAPDAMTTEGNTATTAAPPSTGTELVISAVDSEGFSTSTLEAKVGEITIVFQNKDGGDEGHNIHVITDTDDFFTDVADGPVDQTLTFTIGTPGEYEYVCDTHTETMFGKLIVSG